MKKLTKSSLYLPIDLHRELKIMAVRLNLTMNEALEIAVREWVSIQDSNLCPKNGNKS